MKVKDESEWQLFLAEVAADPDPIAETFREWLIAWADAAEKLLADWETSEAFPGHDPHIAVDALRDSLIGVCETKGRIGVGLVGQALVIYGTHWHYAADPDDFFAALTPIEQNLVADVMIAKGLQLEQRAQTEEDRQLVEQLLYGKRDANTN